MATPKKNTAGKASRGSAATPKKSTAAAKAVKSAAKAPKKATASTKKSETKVTKKSATAAAKPKAATKPAAKAATKPVKKAAATKPASKPTAKTSKAAPKAKATTKATKPASKSTSATKSVKKSATAAAKPKAAAKPATKAKATPKGATAKKTDTPVEAEKLKVVAETPAESPATKKSKKAPAKKVPEVEPQRPHLRLLEYKPQPKKSPGLGRLKIETFVPTPLTAEQVDRDPFLSKQKGKLQSEKEDYLKQISTLRDEVDQMAEDSEPGDTQFDEESGEGASLNVDREHNLHLISQNQQIVEEIDRAIAKMERGTYGRCEHCNREIAKARLEALPFAALCVDCKSGGLARR